MSTRIGKRTAQRKVVRYKRKKRIRANLMGTAERPRLSVFRSNKHLYVQLIDDAAGKTLASASTQSEELSGKGGKSVEIAKQLGLLLAKRVLAKNIQNVVFDRSGYLYHGRIRTLAEAAREGGLKF